MKKKDKWTNPGKYTPCNIGGQALLEGVMMRGKTSSAICCRDEKGELVVYTERTSERKKWYHRWPIIRGITSFLFSLVGGVKYIWKSAEIYAGDDEDMKLGKGAMIFSVLLAVILAIGLFIFLPTLAFYLIFDLAINLSEKVDPNVYILIMSLFKGVMKVIILVFYLFLTSRLKDIRRTYMYHGAEHRTINCFEHNLPLTVENVQSCSTRHARCGTTFMFYTVMISVFVMALITWILALLGVTTLSVQAVVNSEGLGKVLYNLICMGVGLLSLPFIAGVSYELLRLIAKAPDNWFFRIFKAPGFALQALTTKIPDDDQAETAIVAFKKVMEMDADESIPTLDFYEMTMTDARAFIEKKYAEAGVDDPSEPDWLLVNVLGVKRNQLVHVKKLTKEQALDLKAKVEKRVQGLPLDYVTGKSDFLGYEINVDERVHLPRMETEVTALEGIMLVKNNEYKTVLDLMTGSGCIARAFAERTIAEVSASDVSDDALEVARTNLPEAVTLIKSDVFGNISQKYDLIISNPPYIKSSEIDGLQKEVTCQPRISLDGGEDGLDVYRKIIASAPDYINDGGALVLEIGHTQAEEVCALLAEKFCSIKTIKDLSGSDRVITAIKK